MGICKARKKLNSDELSKSFSYPSSFNKFLSSSLTSYGKGFSEIEPWQLTADPEMNTIYSIQFGLPLVKFAQCWEEEMVAFLSLAQARIRWSWCLIHGRCKELAKQNGLRLADLSRNLQIFRHGLNRFATVIW